VVESGHVEQGQVLASMKTHTPNRTFDGAKYLSRYNVRLFSSAVSNSLNVLDEKRTKAKNQCLTSSVRGEIDFGFAKTLIQNAVLNMAQLAKRRN
jgi:hypothetical protein